MNRGLWSNLLRKIVIKTTFFLAEEDSVCVRKKSVRVNSTGHDLYACFL